MDSQPKFKLDCIGGGPDPAWESVRLRACGYVGETEAGVTHDIHGNPIVNSRGEPYNPPATATRLKEDDAPRS